MTIAAIAEANGPWGMRPTPPRRVLIFTTSLGSGGTERVAVNLARWLRDAGHEVCVLTLAETAEDFYTVPDRVERRSLALTGASANPAAALFANARRLAGIRECAMQFRADVVVSLGDQMNVLALLALTGMRCRKIISERSDPARKPMSRGWNLLRSITYARADLHIAQSRYVADWIGARFPRLPSQVIGNAVDLRGDRSAKRQITRTDPAPQILAVGRLTKEKGFDVLLRALAHVRSELRGARLTILGDGPERGRLEAFVAANGLSSLVRFEGQVKNVEDYYPRADLYVLPSRREGFPNALVEAMSFGLPVVATLCPGGILDVVEDGGNGSLVPVEDEQAMGRSIVRLIGDSSRRAMLGARARETAQRYTTDVISAEWRRLIENAVPARVG